MNTDFKDKELKQKVEDEHKKRINEMVDIFSAGEQSTLEAFKKMYVPKYDPKKDTDKTEDQKNKEEPKN